MLKQMLPGPEPIRARMAAAVAAAGYDDIGPAHFNILQAPSPDGVRPTDLAARGQMTKQAANRLIRHLERRGYLRLEPDPVDRRAADRPAHWPRLGRIGVIRVTVEEVERAWSQRLGKRGFEELRRALKELAG